MSEPKRICLPGGVSQKDTDKLVLVAKLLPYSWRATVKVENPDTDDDDSDSVDSDADTDINDEELEELAMPAEAPALAELPELVRGFVHDNGTADSESAVAVDLAIETEMDGLSEV